MPKHYLCPKGKRLFTSWTQVQDCACPNPPSNCPKTYFHTHNGGLLSHDCTPVDFLDTPVYIGVDNEVDEPPV